MSEIAKLSIRDLETRFLRGGESPSAETLLLLDRDPRAGVRRIAAAIRNRAAAREN